MSGHAETLRSILGRYRAGAKLVKTLGTEVGAEIYEQQDREEAALAAAIESLEAKAELNALRERINRTLDGVVEDMLVVLSQDGNFHGAMSVELAIAGVRRALEDKP